MRFGSVCSGIEAASAAWHPLGWRASFLSEIEAFPRSVLAHHYPETPLHGDFTTIKAEQYEPIDLLVGGTPCQSFSVAGLRGGLGDDRGNLALEYLRLADRLRPRWLVWENVPGVLSSNGGRDFGSILGGMGELGYGVAYRVLDAQYFGVAQRRRRVFVVGYLGDWRRAAAVLFERHSLSGHPAPRREAGKGVAGALARSSFSGGAGGRPEGAAAGHFVTPTLNASYGEQTGQDFMNGALVAHPAFAIQERAVCENPAAGPDAAGFRSDDAAYTLEARTVPQAVAFNITPSNSNKDYNARESQRAQALTAGGNRPSARGGDLIAFNSREDICPSPLVAGSLGSSSPQAQAVAFPINTNALRGDTCAKTLSRDAAGVMRLRDPGLGIGADGDPADTLQAAGPGAVAFMENQRGEVRQSDITNLTVGGGKPGQGYPAALQGSAVRRLTPRECERLQGFPDDYTLVLHRGKRAADGPRYKALGNSMAVPVMRWIGARIEAVDALPVAAEAAA